MYERTSIRERKQAKADGFSMKDGTTSVRETARRGGEGGSTHHNWALSWQLSDAPSSRRRRSSSSRRLQLRAKSPPRTALGLSALLERLFPSLGERATSAFALIHCCHKSKRMRSRRTLTSAPRCRLRLNLPPLILHTLLGR